MLKVSPLLAALALVATPSLNAEQPRVVDKLPVLAGTEHIEHLSPALERPFQIFIKRPDIAPPEGESVPVIYVLDADQAFPLLASYSWSLTFSEEMPPSVIVGIGYGSTAQGVNFRGTDYTVPSATREGTGGADAFIDVIESEIMPLVESKIDDEIGARTLVGQSLGGHFVLYQALAKPGLFDLGIAINPAIHNSPEWFMEQLEALEPTGQKQSLFISMADNDVPRFAVPGRAFVSALADKQNLPWCVRAEWLSDHMHLTSMPRAFRQAMRWQAQPEPECGMIDPEIVTAYLMDAASE